ncbi:hypothetical protein ACLOJK_039610 [Asimina triloba]
MCGGAGEKKIKQVEVGFGFGFGHLKIADGCCMGPVKASIVCELCDSRAVLYCLADDAFLCKRCDASVHRANFLALRHVRCLLCRICQKHNGRHLVGLSIVASS